MQVQVSPARALIDEPLQIRVTGAPPGATVVLRVSGLSPTGDELVRGGGATTMARSGAPLANGEEWASRAAFRADSKGTVDPSRDAPRSGSYSGVDASGLLWSMTPVRPDAGRAFALPTSSPVAFRISAAVEGTSDTAEAEVTRVVRDDDVTVTELSAEGLAGEKGLVGRFFAKRGLKRAPAIVVFGGSSGGLVMEPHAALYASRGFATLLLGYFKYEGLAPTLTHFPLEYFALGLQWLQSRPEVDPSRIGMTGTSKGAELTLLLASMFPEVRCAVPIVGTSMIFGVRGFGAGTSSPWSYRGAPWPFVPMPEFVEEDGKDPANPLRVTGAFFEAMKNTAAVEAATIPAEKITAPLLMLSGEDDGTWPSAHLSRLVMQRLDAHKHATPYKHVSFAGAGHGMFAPHWPLQAAVNLDPRNGGMWRTTGGTPAANAAARVGAWKEQLGWFREHLA